MVKLEPYIRKVYYYETDAMGIVHHSNYIRWFEEARINFMDEIGYCYTKVSDAGIDIAVLEVICRYKRIVRFGDTLEITPKIINLTPLKMLITYEIFNLSNKKICTTGESLHCFLDKNHKIVRLNRVLPELFNIFESVKGK